MEIAYGRGKPTQATLDNPVIPKRIRRITISTVPSPRRSGRVCKCGTVLSIYNPDRTCNLCKHKKLGIDDL